MNSRRKRRSAQVRRTNGRRRGAYDRSWTVRRRRCSSRCSGQCSGQASSSRGRSASGRCARRPPSRSPSSRPASPPCSACSAPAPSSSTRRTRWSRPPRRRTPSGWSAATGSRSQELADLIRQVRRDGQIRETELVMARGAPGGSGRRAPSRSRSPLSQPEGGYAGADHLVLLVDDESRSTVVITGRDGRPRRGPATPSPRSLTCHARTKRAERSEQAKSNACVAGPRNIGTAPVAAFRPSDLR